MAGKAALGGGVKVQYGGETVEGDTATVETAVAARDGSDLRLDFRMVWRADRWVVRDVVMEGVSTMENYHAQFQRVVRDSSWRDLMGQLRAKVGAPAVQVAAEPAPPPRLASSSPDRPPRPTSIAPSMSARPSHATSPQWSRPASPPATSRRCPCCGRRPSPSPSAGSRHRRRPWLRYRRPLPPVVAGPVAALDNVETSRPARMTTRSPVGRSIPRDPRAASSRCASCRR